LINQLINQSINHNNQLIDHLIDFARHAKTSVFLEEYWCFICGRELGRRDAFSTGCRAGALQKVAQTPLKPLVLRVVHFGRGGHQEVVKNDSRMEIERIR